MSKRLDIQSGDGLVATVESSGMQGILAWSGAPPGAVNATTGVPINGTSGYAVGALWFNPFGSPGSSLYINDGTNTSSIWNPIGSSIDLDAGRIVNVTASTLTVTQAAHSGKIITLNNATGVAVTLPNATGSGAVYTFFNGTALSGGSHVITRGRTADSMAGSAGITITSTGGAQSSFPTASNSNVITLNATTTGGVQAGDYIVLEDVAANQWSVTAELIGSGTLATPFTHT